VKPSTKPGQDQSSSRPPSTTSCPGRSPAPGRTTSTTWPSCSTTARPTSAGTWASSCAR